MLIIYLKERITWRGRCFQLTTNKKAPLEPGKDIFQYQNNIKLKYRNLKILDNTINLVEKKNNLMYL